LVLEYVENGSLDKTLFSTKGSHISLEWNNRFKIALGVAKGLAYLHHECLEWVIHCDLKPENILLDEKLEPKITDFGLAKLLNRRGSNKNISRIHGTRGYIAPEWLSSHPITAKVDVYSFGVVLLELLKGARVSDWSSNADEEVEMVLQRVIKKLAENLMLEGDEQLWITEFIDSRLDGQFNNVQARKMVMLAVSCVEEDSRKRPTMENVVQMLLLVDEASGIIQQYSASQKRVQCLV
jgi:serine/threonine protein kinase